MHDLWDDLDQGGKMAKQLTDRGVRSLTSKPGVHRVARRLYLRVKPSLAAYWVMRYSKDRKAVEMSLGPYETLSLAQATAQAAALQVDRKNGTDPLKARRAALQRQASALFQDVATALIESKRAGWKNEKHASQWRNTLTTYVFPAIGSLDVAAVDTEHVLKILKPIWTTKTETATRVRQRIEAVLNAAAARDLRSGDNPARWKGHLDNLLAKIPKKERTKHHAAIAWSDMPEFMAELRQKDGTSAKALEFCILTATRTGEAIKAQWPEVDLDGGVWTIPATRMKAKREHRVALSSRAVELLRALPRMEGEAWIFPGSRKGRPLSNMSMLELLRGMRPGLTVHGCRSSFRDWASEATLHSPELAEMALAHVITNQTEAAYRRGDVLERRRTLMEDWSNYLSPPKTCKVIPIHGASA